MPQSNMALSLRRALHPIYRSLETAVHPLRYLFLEITQKCNLKCLHCGSDCGKKPRPDELSTKEWIDFIDYLGDRISAKNKPILVITGGEPLCHPDLETIVDRARGRGFPAGMVTNGYLLSREKSIKITKKLASITVSLDGLKESHDWLRGTPGSFERAVAGIEQIVRQPIRLVDVVTCVNPRNLSELPQIFELLKKIGIRRWRLFNIFPKGRAAANRELIMSEEELKKMFGWIRETRRKIKGTGFALDFSCEGYLPPKLDAEVRDEPFFCRAGICIGSVLCDGAISACPNITRDLVQGNIRKDDSFEVWENGFQQYRDRGWMKKGECEDCSHWKRCKGNSLHLWDSSEQKSVLCYRSIDL
jgi:radical SAM enzyme (rSAM/lipoprotein system)